MDIEEGEIVISDEEDILSFNQRPDEGFHRDNPCNQIDTDTKLHGPVTNSKRHRCKSKGSKDCFGLRQKDIKTKRRRKSSSCINGGQIGQTDDSEYKFFVTSHSPKVASVMHHNAHGKLDSSYKISKKKKKKRKSVKVEDGALNFDSKPLRHDKKTIDKSLFKKVVSNSGPHSTHSEKSQNSSLRNKLVTSGLAKDLPSTKLLENESTVSKSKQYSLTSLSGNACGIIKESMESKQHYNNCEEDNDSEIEIIIPPKKIPPLITLDSDEENSDDLNMHKSYQNLDSEPIENLKNSSDLTIRPNCNSETINITSPSFSGCSSLRLLDSDKDILPYYTSSPSSVSNEVQDHIIASIENIELPSVKMQNKNEEFPSSTSSCNGNTTKNLAKFVNDSLHHSTKSNDTPLRRTKTYCSAEEESIYPENMSKNINMSKQDTDHTISIASTNEKQETLSDVEEITTDSNLNNLDTLSKKFIVHNFLDKIPCSETPQGKCTPATEETVSKDLGANYCLKNYLNAVEDDEPYSPTSNYDKFEESKIGKKIELDESCQFVKTDTSFKKTSKNYELELTNIQKRKIINPEKSCTHISGELYDTTHDNLSNLTRHFESVNSSNDDDLSHLRLLALSSKGKVNNDVIQDTGMTNSTGNLTLSNTSVDDDYDNEDEDILLFRVEALKSAVIKKHEERKKRGLTVKKTSRTQSNDNIPIARTPECSNVQQCKELTYEKNTNGSLQGEEDMDIASDSGEDIIQDKVDSIVSSNSTLTSYLMLRQSLPSAIVTCSNQQLPPPPPPPPTLIFPLLPPPPPPPTLDHAYSTKSEIIRHDPPNKNNLSLSECGNQQYEQTKFALTDNIDYSVSIDKVNTTECDVWGNNAVPFSDFEQQQNHEKNQNKSASNVNEVKVNLSNLSGKCNNPSKPNLKTILGAKTTLTKNIIRRRQQTLQKSAPKGFQLKPRSLILPNKHNLCTTKSQINRSRQLPTDVPAICSATSSEIEKNQRPQNQDTERLIHKGIKLSSEVNNGFENNKCLRNNPLSTAQLTPAVDDLEMDLSNMIVLDEVGMSPEHYSRTDKYSEYSVIKEQNDENKFLLSDNAFVATTNVLLNSSHNSPTFAPHEQVLFKSVEKNEIHKNSRIGLKPNNQGKVGNLEKELKMFSVTRRIDNDLSQYNLSRFQKKELGRSVVQKKNSLKVVIPSELPPQSFPTFSSPPVVDRLVIKVGQDTDSEDEGDWLRKVHYTGHHEQLPPESVLTIDHELERSIDLLLLSARNDSDLLKNVPAHSGSLIRNTPSVGIQNKTNSNIGQRCFEPDLHRTNDRNKLKHIPTQSGDLKTLKQNNKEKRTIHLRDTDTPMRLLPKEKQQEYYRLKRIIREKEWQRKKSLKMCETKTGNQETKLIATKQKYKENKSSVEKSQSSVADCIMSTTMKEPFSDKNTSLDSDLSTNLCPPIIIKTKVMNDHTKDPVHIEHNNKNQVSIVKDFGLVNIANERSSIPILDGNQSQNGVDFSVDVTFTNQERPDDNKLMPNSFLNTEQSKADEIFTEKEKININVEGKLCQNQKLDHLTEPVTGIEELNNEELLSSNQAQLLNERFMLIEDLTTVSESLGELEREQEVVSAELITINRLRKELLEADKRLMTQAAAAQRLEHTVYKARLAVYTRHLQIEELDTTCREVGLRLRGPEYQVPTVGSEFMQSKIEQINKKIDKVRSNKKEIIKNIMGRADIEEELAEGTNSLLQKPEITHTAPLPLELLIGSQSWSEEHMRRLLNPLAENKSLSSSTLSSQTVQEQTHKLDPSFKESINSESLEFLSLCDTNIMYELYNNTNLESQENQRGLSSEPSCLSFPTTQTCQKKNNDNSNTDYFELTISKKPNADHFSEKRKLSEDEGNQELSLSNKKPTPNKADIPVKEMYLTASGCEYAKTTTPSKSNNSRLRYKSVLQYNKKPINRSINMTSDGEILCRYELGGRCQDNQCKYKHLLPIQNEMHLIREVSRHFPGL